MRQVISCFADDVAFMNCGRLAGVHPVVELHVDGVDGQLFVLRVVESLDHQVSCQNVRSPLLALALVDVLTLRQVDPKPLLRN